MESTTKEEKGVKEPDIKEEDVTTGGCSGNPLVDDYDFVPDWTEEGEKRNAQLQRGRARAKAHYEKQGS